jgi:hypothetical protein
VREKFKELVALTERCWDADPDKRPSFAEIVEYLAKYKRERKLRGPFRRLQRKRKSKKGNGPVYTTDGDTDVNASGFSAAEGDEVVSRTTTMTSDGGGFDRDGEDRSGSSDVGESEDGIVDSGALLRQAFLRDATSRPMIGSKGKNKTDDDEDEVDGGDNNNNNGQQRTKQPRPQQPVQRDPRLLTRPPPSARRGSAVLPREDSSIN